MIFVIGIAALGTVGFGVFAWRPSIARIPRPDATRFAPALVAKGAVLASAGNCARCHTVRDGQPYAGGYAMKTAVGTVYATNITPDPRTGIGNWSEQAFDRAMRQGVRRDGAHLFPVFPYGHFSKLADGDVAALYAYFMTRTPVFAREESSTIPFPLNVRALQAGWKGVSFRPGRFVPDPERSAEWNRGAYLSEAVAHCGGCHTPRDILGAEKTALAYTGGRSDGWTAPALPPARGAAAWSHEDLVTYLSGGTSPRHRAPAGPMAAVARSLAKLPPADVAAIATYFTNRDGGVGHTPTSHAVTR